MNLERSSTSTGTIWACSRPERTAQWKREADEASEGGEEAGVRGGGREDRECGGADTMPDALDYQ